MLRVLTKFNRRRHRCACESAEILGLPYIEWQGVFQELFILVFVSSHVDSIVLCCWVIPFWLEVEHHQAMY